MGDRPAARRRADRPPPTTPPSTTPWRWLEREAAFTRGGADGVQQLDTTGPARRGVRPPRLPRRRPRPAHPRRGHLQGPQSAADGTPGRWLALDARVLFKATVTASERYNTRIEAELTAGSGSRSSPAPTPTRPPRRASARSAKSPACPRSCRRSGPSGGLGSTCAGPHWRPRSRPNTAGRPPRWRRSSWPSRPPWIPGTPSTNPAPKPQQRATWRAEAAHLLGSPDRVDQLVDTVVTAARQDGRTRRTRVRRTGPSSSSPTTPDASSSQAGPPGRSGTSAPRPNARSATGRAAGVRADIDVDKLVDQVVRRVLHPKQSHAADPTRPGPRRPRFTGAAAPPGRLQRLRRRRLPAVHLGHRAGRRDVPRRGRPPHATGAPSPTATSTWRCWSRSPTA